MLNHPKPRAIFSSLNPLDPFRRPPLSELSMNCALRFMRISSIFPPLKNRAPQRPLWLLFINLKLS